MGGERRKKAVSPIAITARHNATAVAPLLGDSGLSFAHNGGVSDSHLRKRWTRSSLARWVEEVVCISLL